MLKIDEAIFDTDKVICKNINKFNATERGLLSQNILSQLRNLVEYIFMKVYDDNADPNDYSLRVLAIKNAKTKGNLKFLNKFHSFLQKSASHYTLDEGGSERLMLKYYEYLLKIKIFLKDAYKLDVLDNIDKFPLNTDSGMKEYYEKIEEKINLTETSEANFSNYKDRYYIQKVKPFFVHHRIYYEVTFLAANDNNSKFNRVIAFTKYELLDNYAVKLSVRNDIIKIMDKDMPIQIIDGWEVSIRPCEISNFIKIFNRKHQVQSSTYEYIKLMEFMTRTKMNLVDIIDADERYYCLLKEEILQDTEAIHFFDIFDCCREMCINKSKGYNVIRYLLYKMNNNILRNQLNECPCNKLSDLHLQYGCIPFDQMPFASSLIYHNPKISDLLECIDSENREHEFLARKIKNNIDSKGVLFTPKNDVEKFQNIGLLIQKHNSHLYYKHEGRKLKVFSRHLYIKEYAEDTVDILNKLKEFSDKGLVNYTSSVESWLSTSSYYIDCDEKLNALKQMFSDSHVALIYGSAGTGKSTLINHISNFFNDRKKIFLAITNPAVDNLKRKVNASNCEFKTINSFLSKKNENTKCDLLVIDECSTVSNKDMKLVLEKVNTKLLVLVWDIFKIKSITFGNWFHIIRSFIPEKSVFELTKPYRTIDEGLLTIWERVRNLDDAILEPLVKRKYTNILNKSIFDNVESDQIILCLNYDGLYGINNINRFLQANNPHKPVQWGINIYKVGDPILFNDIERFSPLIYNNMKGNIVGINIEDKKIWFDIELDKAINELDVVDYDFKLIGSSLNGNSVIRFYVNEYESTDEDNDAIDTVVPFQVSYAISIHKAQGLEYNSVKIVITDEIGELITHNVFYTAITRAKEKLMIYWTPETEKKVLSNLRLKNNTKDVGLLTSLYSL